MSHPMFVVNNRPKRRPHDMYEYVELIVHGDITLFRRKIGDGDNWERQLPTCMWEDEDILGKLVTECFDSVHDGYSWTDAA